MSKNKSTNVRAREGAIKMAFKLAEHVSPKLAARAAGLLFRKTPPRGESKRTPALFNRAARVEVTSKGQKLAVWSWGIGPTILLVHGWGGRATQMRSFAEPFLERGFRVVAFDAPGHGHSTGSTLTLPDYALAIQDVAAAVGPVEAIVAHSFGGAASSFAISTGLEVNRAVFIGAPSNALNWLKQMTTFLGLSEKTTNLTQEHLEALIGMPFSRFTATDLGPALRMPVLLVHDRQDAEVPHYNSEHLAREAPQATLLSTEGLGHRRILHSRSVIASVLSFLGADAHEAARCDHCGNTLSAAEAKHGTVCDNCDLELELANPERRWHAQSQQSLAA